MPIPPIQAAGALIAAAPLATAAVSGVSATFADLLSAAARPLGKGETSGAPGADLAALGGGFATTPAGSGEAKLRSQTQALLRRFHELLQGLLQDRDIDAGGGFRLQADSSGAVRVAGGHSESSRIEELFASYPDLRELFDRIVANANLLRAVEQSAGAGAASGAGNLSLLVDEQRAAVAFGE